MFIYITSSVFLSFCHLRLLSFTVASFWFFLLLYSALAKNGYICCMKMYVTDRKACLAEHINRVSHCRSTSCLCLAHFAHRISVKMQRGTTWLTCTYTAHNHLPRIFTHINIYTRYTHAIYTIYIYTVYAIRADKTIRVCLVCLDCLVQHRDNRWQLTS